MNTPFNEYKNFKSPVVFKIKPKDKLGKTRNDISKRIEYYYSGKAQKNNKTKNRTYLDYITRGDAIYKLNLTKNELIELNKLRETNSKEYYKKIEYLKTVKEEVTGVWSKEGLVNEERLGEIKSNLLKINQEKQFVWDTVISFESAFVEKYKIYSPEIVHDVLKDRINMLFKSKGINSDKMEWFFTFHKNTDNPHVHLLFFEKEPTRCLKGYEPKYHFDKHLLEDFRFRFATDLILKEQNIEYKDFMKKRENLVNHFKQSLKEPIIWQTSSWMDVKEIYNDLTSDYEKIVYEINKYNYENNRAKFKKVNSLKYNLLNKTEKQRINKIINHILKNDKNISQEFKVYVKNLQGYQNAVNEINNNKDSKFIYESLYGRDGLYSRIGNRILYAIKRNIDISRKGIISAKYYPKIRKIRISIISDLLIKISKLIKIMNSYVSFETNKTEEIFKERERTKK
ncbi:relaxase MobL [Spiroplasma endosymbiont of Atherix ibis]|uniref:relaxase MobL n=1 Tax=Spiroplasma endosymbiont of Atherix ibis TaxID=3066291 RepID=UPI0030CBF86B